MTNSKVFIADVLFRAAVLLVVAVAAISWWATAPADAREAPRYTGGEAAWNEGVCAEFANGHIVCAPAYSPDGGTIEHLYEDGSVDYRDGWTLGGWDDSPRRFTLSVK